MNISNLKSRFPVFKKNPNLVFLDTAASALKVDEMIEATNNCYTNEYANIHRGNYELSSRLTKKFEDARFMFERSIVFNPKHSNSYLYLAKIYNQEKNQKKEEKNLEATLLIEPNNEEAMLMLMKIALEKSNYSKVKSLSEDFVKVCKNLCDENKSILESLANLEPKNES